MKVDTRTRSHSKPIQWGPRVLCEDRWRVEAVIKRGHVARIERVALIGDADDIS